MQETTSWADFYVFDLAAIEDVLNTSVVNHKIRLCDC